MSFKKWILISIFLLIIILVLGFFLIKNKDLCTKIDDASLLNNCNLCIQAYDPIDCKERVYMDYAMLKNDISICKKMTRVYNQEDCEFNFNLISMRGKEPVYVFDESTGEVTEVK